MKKLLVAGCSHSYGYGLGPKDPTWPRELGKEFGYKVTNISRPGTSLNYSIQNISDQIIKNDFDAVIFQITGFDRFTLPFDGEGPFLSLDIKDRKYNADELYHICLADYTDTLKGKPTFLNTNPEVVKFVYEKIALSKFYINSMFNQIHLLQKFLDSKNIKMALVPYENQWYNPKYKASIWNLRESLKIDKKYYVRKPFLLWLEENYNLNDYFIDEGFHLNVKGQLLFAHEYLIPKLKKLNFFKKSII